jgi:hypothetical protein
VERTVSSQLLYRKGEREIEREKGLNSRHRQCGLLGRHGISVVYTFMPHDAVLLRRSVLYLERFNTKTEKQLRHPVGDDYDYGNDDCTCDKDDNSSVPR